MNVVLITLDTVRADALQIYNPAGAPVPNLQSLAERSIVFEQGISQIPYTLPSHSTLFTSRYPASHGVIDNLRGALPKTFPTLAECFRNQGYDTAGFTGSLVLSHATGINRGFDYYDDYFSKAETTGSSIERIERKAEDVFLSFQHWYEHRKAKNNFFAFLHFYDAHAPYEPNPPFIPTQNNSKERYLGEIRYIDSILGKLFHYLDKQKGAFANTIILVESDHGEMFQEHKEIGHGFFLYEPALRVPFILYVPSLQKPPAPQHVTIPDIVQLLDVAPTLLDLTNVSVPPTMQGESLVPLIQGNLKKNRLGFSETYLAALELGASPLLSVQDEEHKYIQTGRPELYDLKKDPAETTNLVNSEKTVTKNFKQEISRYKDRYASSEKSQRTVSAEETEGFAALGYLGGNVPPQQWDERKDAKDYIEPWNQLTAIKILISRNQFAEALRLINKIKPVLPTKHNALLLDEAQCYSGMGELQKAEAILAPLKTPETLLPLAKIYLKTGRPDQAIKIYRGELNKNFELYKLYNFILILKLAERKQEALKVVEELRNTRENQDEIRPFLAEISFVLEQWEDVEKYCRQLIEQRPWEWKWYALLCDSYEKQKGYGKALALLQQVQSSFAQEPSYLFRVGMLFRLTNQPAKAIRAFSRMIQVSPHDPAGYLQLATEMVSRKYKVDEAIRFAQKGLTLHPNHELQILGHSILYNAFQQKGNLEEAKQELEIVKRLKTSNSKNPKF